MRRLKSRGKDAGRDFTGEGRRGQPRCVIEAVVLNVPSGLGEPVFDTLEGDIARALFAIPAVKGVEFGAGFNAAGMKGSQDNDLFVVKRDKNCHRNKQ